MLVLDRHSGEETRLDTSDGIIIIKVLNVGRNRVKLGIAASPKVTIERDDIVRKEKRPS